MPKLSLYKLFKDNRKEELYLSLNIPRRLRTNLARFRTSSHCLEIEIGRHYNLAREDRLCKLCGTYNIIAIEDEYHVLFHCPSYKHLREVYIPREIAMDRNLFSFIATMRCDNVQSVVSIANFVSSLFKLRQNLL